jgi:hypothetical protein
VQGLVVKVKELEEAFACRQVPYFGVSPDHCGGQRVQLYDVSGPAKPAVRSAG